MIREYKQEGSLRLWKDEHFSDLSKMTVELLDCKSKVENSIKTALDFDDLNRSFMQLIQEHTVNASNELALSISQCFMKAFTTDHPDQINIYAAWQDAIKKHKEAIV